MLAHADCFQYAESVQRSRTNPSALIHRSARAIMFAVALVVGVYAQACGPRQPSQGVQSQMPSFKFEWADLPNGPADGNIVNPKPEDVDKILEILSQGNEGFAILSSGEEQYIQTSPGTANDNVPMLIEYRAGNADAHFELDEEVRGSQRMKQLFRLYLTDPTTISSQGRWKPLKL